MVRGERGGGRPLLGPLGPSARGGGALAPAGCFSRQRVPRASSGVPGSQPLAVPAAAVWRFARFQSDGPTRARGNAARSLAVLHGGVLRVVANGNC